MISDAVAVAVEALVDDPLDAEARAVVLEAMQLDPAGGQVIAEHLRLAMRLSASLRPADDGLADRVDFILRQQSSSQRHRMADAVETTLLRPSQRRRTARRSRPLPYLRYLAAAAVLALMLAGTYLLWPAPAPADGLATLVRTGTDGACEVDGRIATAAEVPLHAGATVHPVRGTALMRWTDGSQVVLHEQSVCVLERPEPGIAMTIRGDLDAEVAPQARNAPFTVRTRHATVQVLGTGFSVAASTAATEVQVRHGSVRVTPAAGGPAVDLADGQRVRFPDQGGVTDPVAAATAPRTRQLTLSPAADATANELIPLKARTAPADELQVKRHQQNGQGYSREAFLRFNLGQVQGRIEAATLYLHVTSRQRPNEHTLAIATQGANWNEATLNWNSRPIGGVPVARQQLPPLGSTIAWDLTSALRDHAAVPVTFCLAAVGDFGPEGFSAYASSHHERQEWRPRLVLRVAEPRRP